MVTQVSMKKKPIVGPKPREHESERRTNKGSKPIGNADETLANMRLVERIPFGGQG